MAEIEQQEQPGETTRFLETMDGQLAGWEHPAARLREALDYDHFRLFAQQVVALQPEDAAPGGIAMAEVLVRLREEEARMLPPGDFLPAFEHYRMMAELDRWVLRYALRHLGQGGGAGKLSVNVSAQTIEEPGFAPVRRDPAAAGVARPGLAGDRDRRERRHRPPRGGGALRRRNRRASAASC